MSSYVDFALSGISITEDGDGNVEVTPAIASTRFDTWSHWLTVAYEALERAEAALVKVREAHDADDDNGLGPALEREFREGMATIAAAASAADAFYASVKERYGEHPDTAKWQQTGLARYKQVAETLRWAWKLKPEMSTTVRTALAQLYKFRDVALHSPAEFRVTEYRRDLDRAVEWRFNWYRADNARVAVQDTTNLLALFLRKPEEAPEQLRDWIIKSQQLRFTEVTGIVLSEVGEPTPASQAPPVGD